MAQQSNPPKQFCKAGPFTLVAFASGANRSVWECADCQGPITLSRRALEHVDLCTALMANNKPCERMYSTRYGCSKHPYYEGHNPHMRKHLCRQPITSYSLPSLSNLMPKSKTQSPRHPSSPVDVKTSSTGSRQSRFAAPNVPPPPPTTPQPGQPKLTIGEECSDSEQSAKSNIMSKSEGDLSRASCQADPCDVPRLPAARS